MRINRGDLAKLAALSYSVGSHDFKLSTAACLLRGETAATNDMNCKAGCL